MTAANTQGKAPVQPAPIDRPATFVPNLTPAQMLAQMQWYQAQLAARRQAGG